MPAKQKRELHVLETPDQDSFERWMDQHHATSDGVWLKIAKKGSARPTPTYAQALEVALSYGWIDGQKAAHDESCWLQRFTRRSPRSKWSQVNRQKALALIEQGRMKPAGLAQVRAAQQDGRWEEAYAPQSRAAVPEDFQRALDQHPEAKAFFESLSAANRYAFLYRLHHSKRPETRATKIERFVEMLRGGKSFHP